MFVVYNKDAQSDHAYLEEHIRGLLEKVGARLVRMSKWDERQLAYEINGQRDGIFYLTYFDAAGESISELRHEIELSELVLRLLILRLDEIPTEEEVARRSGRGGEKASEDGGGDSASAERKAPGKAPEKAPEKGPEKAPAPKEAEASTVAAETAAGASTENKPAESASAASPSQDAGESGAAS
jgi:small subunit ribosomal protein S6